MGYAVVQTPTPTIVTASTSSAIAFASNVTAGDLLILNVRFGTGVTPSVTDNLGDGVAWQQDAITGSNGYLYHKVAGATGACTVTASCGATSTTIRMQLREYSGNLNSNTNVLDGTPVTGGGNQASPLSLTSNSLTVGDLVIMITSGSGSATIAAGSAPVNSDFASLVNANGHVAIEDTLNWTGGAATATFTWTGTQDVHGVIAGYKVLSTTPTKTQPGVARVQTAGLIATQSGKARLQNTASATITGKATIQAIFAQYTVGGLIEETKRKLLGTHRAELNQLKVQMLAGDTSITCNFPLLGIAPGSYVGIDDEIIYVWSVNPQTNQLTQVQRGMLGTTAVLHAANAIIEVNPRFPRFAIRDALQEELLSWGPQVYRVKSATLQTVSGVRGYDIQQLVTDNFYNILSVRRSQPTSTGNANVESWPKVRNWQIFRGAPTTDFPSGAGLIIPDMFTSGSNFASPDGISLTFTGTPLPTLSVLYSCPFKLDSFTDATDIIGYVGLDLTMRDIPALGAAWRLLATREVLRALPEAQGQPADLQFQPPLYIMKMAQGLKATRDSRLADAQIWLMNRYGIENWGL